MALAKVTLEDKYQLESGRVFLTGTQALVRLPMMQQHRDHHAGLNTACFISGYRGSPLGGFDQALWRARDFLRNNHIHFQPGVNEDLGATAVWGSQQVNMFEGARYDGVYSMWYGKGPGVDRTGDVFKHANHAGTSRYGGVLAIAGDDHACKSSTLPHQSEYAFIDAQMPVLNPSGVQEILDLGIFGWELSRFCGCWIGFKTIAETLDSSASVEVDPHRVEIVIPADFEMPPGGLHIRWPDKPLEQELRLQQYKLYAALAFVRANRLDRVVMDSPQPRFGIVTTGKSYLDVRQALDDLGIDQQLAADIGLRVYKVAMTWPLEREGARAFAEGLEEILVVEEKRAVIENQFREQLYNWRADVRPRVVGKFDENGEWVLPSAGELTPARIARVIADRVDRFCTSERIRERLAFLEAKEQALSRPRVVLERVPHFCSGCPHNTSTRVPEGSRAIAGIGCHYMATWMDRRTETFSQMGGEGAAWIGQAPFTETRHVFQNLGDGTYFHSGLLAIRAALAGNCNITYKILYNDAVAMTGGQPVDGALSVPRMTHQLYGEGVRRIDIVSEEPGSYAGQGGFAAGVTLHPRSEFNHLQRELREVPGVSVLIYDQTCATEKRRRRKRGLMPDPAKRAFINQAVCEGCGDCGTASNCLSVIPVETALGRKRAIDQSSCNKDFSCLDGFCPSFVTVHGGGLRKRQASADQAAEFPHLPEPQLPTVDIPYGILVTGVGGTGVVTIGALLGMAAHIEGKGCTVLDMTGLAQKFGAVVSHVRIAKTPEDIHAVRIAAGGANLLLGCDLVVAAGFDALSKLDRNRSCAVVNRHHSMTSEFLRHPDMAFPGTAMESAICEAAGDDHCVFVEATRIATALLGDSIAANLFLVGFAWQKGLIPLSRESIEQAIELNGVAVKANLQAFLWGRRNAHDAAAVETLLTAASDQEPLPSSIEEITSHRVTLLTAYQNRAYARRYTALVERVREREQQCCPGEQGLTRAVAENYARLLAYKDEYEVARLFTDGSFRKQLEQQFEGGYRLRFHMAPPIFAKIDADTGHALKRSFGPWMMGVMSLLSHLKWLRGTFLDPFGKSAERRQERQSIVDYQRDVDELLASLDTGNHALAIEIAGLPAKIRGFGHVRQANLSAVSVERERLLTAFKNPDQRQEAA